MVLPVLPGPESAKPAHQSDRPGERVRLRFINGSSMSTFDVRIPGLAMMVGAADGQHVHPVTVDELRIATAETFDVIVTPGGADAYTIFAQSMDRSGYARGTLTPRAGMTAAAPAPDKPEPTSMGDMMGDMMGGKRAHHARTEYGPSVDMRVDTPRANLDDPGVGLRDNGRRVLTYPDLHTIVRPLKRPRAGPALPPRSSCRSGRSAGTDAPTGRAPVSGGPNPGSVAWGAGRSAPRPSPAPVHAR